MKTFVPLQASVRVSAFKTWLWRWRRIKRVPLHSDFLMSRFLSSVAIAPSTKLSLCWYAWMGDRIEKLNQVPVSFNLVVANSSICAEVHFLTRVNMPQNQPLLQQHACFSSTLQQRTEEKGWAFDVVFNKDCSRLPWSKLSHYFVLHCFE